MKNHKTIAEGWDELRAVWIPDDAPDAQVQFGREAFYAGALHMFNLMRSTAGMRDDEFEKVASVTDKELRDFGLEHDLRYGGTRGEA